MRRFLPFMFIALVGCLFPSHSRAQQTQNACIVQFYDPSEFNFLSFKNICGGPVYVVWISRSPGLKGSVDIESGAKASTGKFAKDIQLFGGISIFACFKGYIPVDAAGEVVTRPNTDFRCKRY